MKFFLLTITYTVLIFFAFGFTPTKVKYIRINDANNIINTDIHKKTTEKPALETKGIQVQPKPDTNRIPSMPPVPYIPGSPVVIAHRGDHTNSVENTIPAIEDAIKINSKFAEIDVMLTKDNVPIVFHDGYLNRLANINEAVFNLTYDELKNISLTQGKFKSRIYTLQEVITYCNGKIPLIIEFKLHGYEQASVVDKTMEIVKKYGKNPTNFYYFQSFSYDLVKEANENYPQYMTGYLVNADSINDLLANINTYNFDFVSAEQSIVTPELVSSLGKLKKPLYAWTVNDKEEIEKLKKMGVAGIITDQPGLDTFKSFKN